MKNLLVVLIALSSMLHTSAQGYYMEFIMTSLSSKQGFSGNFKTYHQSGNSRTEMNMQMPGMPGGGMDMVSLILAKSPNTIYTLNATSKTYTEIAIASSEEYKDYSDKDYEVTIVGKETVNGYSTTHVKVKVKGQKNEMEMWTTKDIAGFADYASLKSKFSQPSMYKALEDKGAAGMAVRVKTVEGGNGVQLDLVKAEKRNNPAALFSLDGYTKGASFDFSKPGNVQEMMQQIQNMTPEQRKAFEEQMKNMYSPKN